jgi:hypothetical protein
VKKYLRPKRLEWQNFRSFAGKHSLDLAPGLYRLAGVNNDTRGDSGAGKTTVLLLTAYLLDVCPYSAKAMATWPHLATGPMEVAGHFDSHEGPIVLRRGAGGFSIEVGGERLKGAAAEERLDKLCGMGAKLRKAMIYRQQRKTGAFLSMDNRQKVRFLVDVLGIGWLEKAAAESLKKVGPLEKAQAETAAKAQAAREEWIRRTDEVPDEVVKEEPAFAAEVTTAREALMEAGAKLAAAEKAYLEAVGESKAAVDGAGAAEFAEAARERRAAELARAKKAPVDRSGAEAKAKLEKGCSERLGALRESDRKKETQHRAEARRKADMWATDLALCGAAADEAERQVLELTVKANRLREAVCYTCGRPWEESRAELEAVEVAIREKSHTASKAADEAKALAAKAKEPEEPFVHDPKIEAMEAALAKIRLEAAAASAEAGVAERLAQGEADAAAATHLKRAAALQDEGDRARRAVQKSWDAKNLTASADVVAGRREKAAAEQRHQQAVAYLSEHRQAVRESQSRIESTEKAAADAEGRLLEAVKASNLADAALGAEGDYLDMVRGFLGRVFGEVLAEISEEANGELARLPNVRHMSVRFSESKDTEAGTKDNISLVVSMGGEEHELESGASGGQQAAVELAVDLAVTKVVGRRTACDLGVLMLDEALVGFDVPTKRECLEVLRRHAEEGHAVLVVEHATEFGELFDRVLSVEFERGKSRLAL